MLSCMLALIHTCTPIQMLKNVFHAVIIKLVVCRINHNNNIDYAMNIMYCLFVVKICGVWWLVIDVM